MDEWHNPEYDKMTLFLHTNTSNWSINGKPGEFGERWLYWLDHMKPEMRIRIAGIMGYSGIAIYGGEYTKKELMEMRQKFSLLFERPTFKNARGTWEYYSLRNFESMELSKNKWSDLKEEILTVYPHYMVYDESSGLQSDTMSVNGEDALLLEWKEVQYGPYGYYEAGEYEVVVHGDHLADAKVDCVAQEGTINYKVDMMKQDDASIRYKVTFAEPVQDVEFRTFNESDNTISIKNVEVSKIIENGISAREYWERFCELFSLGK